MLSYTICGTGPSAMYMFAFVTKSCLLFCDPMDCRPPGSFVHGLLQARILEWFAISFSRGSSWPRDWTPGSRIVADALPSEPNRSELPQIKGLSLQRLLIKATHLSEYSSGCTQSYWGFLPPACQVFGTERCLIPGQIASLIPRRAHLTLFPARPVVTSACLTLTHLPVGVQWPRPDPHFP